MVFVEIILKILCERLSNKKHFKQNQAYHKYTRYWTFNSAPFLFSIILLNITSVHFPPLSSVHVLASSPSFGMRLLSSTVHVKTYIHAKKHS